MYAGTEKFEHIIKSDNRKFHSRIKISDKVFDDSIKNINIFNIISDSDKITVGGAYSSYVDIETCDLNGNIVSGNEFQLEIGLEVDNDEIEWCSFGFFTAEKPKTTFDGLTSFTAYDRIYSKMSGAFFSELTYPAKAVDVLKEIAKKTGVLIDTSWITEDIILNQRKTASDNNLDSKGNIVKKDIYENPFDGYTYKEALGYIAMLYCKYAVADRNGTVKFLWYNTINNYKVTPDEFYTDFEKNETAFVVDRITCNTGNEEISVGTGINELSLENPLMTKERLEYIYEQLQTLQFVPVHFSFYGDLRVEMCDVVKLEDLNGGIYRVPIMSVSQYFDGGMKTEIQSFGNSEQGERTRSPTLNRLNRQYTELLLVKELVGKKANFETVVSLKGEFDELISKTITSDNLSSKVAELGLAKIDFSNINEAAIKKLFAETGLIEDLTITDGRVNGELVGVKISGDLIEGETIVANKLVIKGEDGLYYKLNTDGVTIEKEQTDYNSLNGQVIRAKSVTSDKIYVSDLVAFDATIGGFHISDDAIYSGMKSSLDNLTEGIYASKDGQLSIGESDKFIKYYTTDSGKRRLEVRADEFTFSTGKSIRETLQEDIDSMEIGGRNLIRNSMTLLYKDYYFTTYEETDDIYIADENGYVLLDEINNRLAI